jgi:hypothetical protein
VRLKGLGNLKKSTPSSEVEPATFGLVAQSLHNYATAYTEYEWVRIEEEVRGERNKRKEGMRWTKYEQGKEPNAKSGLRKINVR